MLWWVAWKQRTLWEDLQKWIRYSMDYFFLWNYLNYYWLHVGHT
jgi:hypothetical protein